MKRAFTLSFEYGVLMDDFKHFFIIFIFVEKSYPPLGGFSSTKNIVHLADSSKMKINRINKNRHGLK